MTHTKENFRFYFCFRLVRIGHKNGYTSHYLGIANAHTIAKISVDVNGP